jgi:DNA polymerase III delta subunit
MISSPDALFQRAQADDWPEVFFLQGNDEFLRRELKDALRQQGFEILYKDLKRKGPEGQDEDLSCSTSLFQPRTFVWLETQARPDRWSEDSKRVWARMRERADGRGLVLCVQTSSGEVEKHSSAKASKKEAVDCGSGFRFHVLDSERSAWLDRMNAKRGGVLSQEQLRHLGALEADLMTLDQFVELWSLGGDTWARIGVSYVAGETRARQETVNNPAYAWVDSFLEAHPEKGLKMLARLVKDGQDPLPLIGLLSKTLRIWATLEQGGVPRGEAPFLVEKVRKAMGKSRSTKNPSALNRGVSSQRGQRLLEAAAQMDVWLKSRPVDAEGLLVRLTALSR